MALERHGGPMRQHVGPLVLWALKHDAEKLHDFSGNIMRQNKHLERNRDSDLSHFALDLLGQASGNGRDEARSHQGLVETARLVDMAGEKIAGQAKTGFECDGIGRLVASAEKGGEREKPVGPRRAGIPAHGTAAFRRDIDQIMRLTGRRAGQKIPGGDSSPKPNSSSSFNSKRSINSPAEVSSDR